MPAMKEQPLSAIILDQDEVLFPHWEGLGACVDAVMIYEIQIRLKANKINVLDSDVKNLIDQSYKHNGLGIVQICRAYGLDSKGIHRDYHKRLIDLHILPEFEKNIAPFNAFYGELRGLLQKGIEQGIKFFSLTHGDDLWAQKIPTLLGLDEFITFRRGIDSYDFRLKNVDRSLYIDFLKDAGYHGAFESVMMVDDRYDNLSPAKALGIRSAWIHNANPPHGSEPSFKSLVHCLRNVLHQNQMVLNRRGLAQPSVRAF